MSVVKACIQTFADSHPEEVARLLVAVRAAR